ncbi:cholinesterase 2 isoform X2 [Cimex lectularius]|nr:cholinesterase 2 isoform X2 [Cimex lectularius]XP_024082047.1 cholinesterase 2 isoform X2 [Cimex lectularius]
MPSCLQDKKSFENNDVLKLATRLFPGKALEFNEDCLYLNVYVPDGKTPRGFGWPVAIWLHPGDFMVGSPNLWDATALAIKQKVIVVTPAYRLGALGFLSMMDDSAPGNVGLLDQLAAMEWVQEHIQHFNGSATDVVLWGHSAGSISTSLHLISELSAGKFHRAITMSGNFMIHNAIKNPNPNAILSLKEEFYCSEEPAELLACLRNAPVATLFAKTLAFDDWGPIVDGLFKNVTKPFLKEDPKQLLEDGRINRVPLMAGYTDMEDVNSINADISKSLFDDTIRQTVIDDALPVTDNETCTLNEELLVDSILFYYTPTSIPEDPTIYRRKYIDFTTDKKYGSSTFEFGMFVSKYSPTYLYRFDYKLKTSPIADVRDWVTVPHQYDLPIVWGMPYWTSLSPQVIWNTVDKKTSDIVMGLFGNFTKYSIPVQSKKTIQWDPFTKENPRIFLIDKNFSMSDSSSFDYKSLKFWNEYYPKIVLAANNCCNMTASANCLEPFPLTVISFFIFNFYLYRIDYRNIFIVLHLF